MFWSNCLFGQNFKGTITGIEESPISDCYILLLDSQSNEVINYAIPNKHGEYFMSVNDKELTSVKIKCQGMAYNPVTKSLKINREITNYTINFKLTIKKNKLKEVIVISKPVAVKIKNDTVVYKVSKFKGVNDKKIINVLKHMPGIQVNERSGLIRYKGKPIETLLLNGDNLFGKRYSIGAKNISSDLVDKVEAIEDFHYNKLKKGLKRSDKVVINLKFKKSKFKVSGEISGGVGKQHYILNADIINLSNNIKGFGVFNFNNISLNETPFQKQTYVMENHEEIENSSIDFFVDSNVTQYSIFPRSYINNVRFSSLSNLFKITKKIKLRNSLSYFKDNYQYSFFSKNNIIINNDSIQTTNKTSNNTNPLFLTMTNDANIDISTKSILTYSNRMVVNKSKFNQRNLQNHEIVFNTRINHSKFYFRQNLNYAVKLSSHDLLEFNFSNSYDSKNQQLNLLNQTGIFYGNSVFNNENFDSKREKFLSNITYLKKIGNWNFDFILKYISEIENFNINIKPNIYNYHFGNDTYHFVTSTNFKKNKKLSFSGKIDIGFSKRKLFNHFDREKKNVDGFVIGSKFQMKYKLNKNNLFVIKLENKNKLNSTYYLIANPILIDSRTIISNDVSLDFQKTLMGYINFSHYNLLKQSSFSINSSLEYIKNSINTRQKISKNINIITYFQTPRNIKNINFSASKTFFIDYINNKISINLNANYGQHINVINGVFNRVQSSNYNTNIEINSAFKGFFNYKSDIGLTFVNNQLENGKVFFYSNFNVRLETIFQFSKKAYCKLENELLLPGGKEFIRNQLFVDFSFFYRTKNIEYFILSKNLLNKSGFNQIYTNEFSTTIITRNLFRRYIVFGLNYQF